MIFNVEIKVSLLMIKINNYSLNSDNINKVKSVFKKDLIKKHTVFRNISLQGKLHISMKNFLIYSENPSEIKMFYFQLDSTCAEVTIDCFEFDLRSNAICTRGDYLAISTSEGETK